MIINQEEYEILKTLDDKWRWLAKETDKSIFVYDLHPIENWSNPNVVSKHIAINKGLFKGITNGDFIIYSIQEMVKDYETRKTLDKFFSVDKEND